jgi:hypothetical protein
MPEGERDDAGGMPGVGAFACGSPSSGGVEVLRLRRTGRPQDPARQALGHAVLGHHALGAGAAAGGAHRFRWRGPSVPEAASFTISLSIARPDTARRSRAFSASSSLRRFA